MHTVTVCTVHMPLSAVAMSPSLGDLSGATSGKLVLDPGASATWQDPLNLCPGAFPICACVCVKGLSDQGKTVECLPLC